MSRLAVHPWRKYLTPAESAEVAKIELHRKAMSAKIRALNKRRNAIRMRSSKRASRGNKISSL